MPNIHGQVTPDDFRAPKGRFRIVQEEMSDGQLNIVADLYTRKFADFALNYFCEKCPSDVFTLCDESGVITTALASNEE